MRVAVITSFPRDLDRPHGGVEAVSVNLVCALTRRADFEVHVVTADRKLRASESYSASPPPAAARPLPSSVQDSLGLDHASGSFQVHRLPAPSSSLLRYSVGVGRRQLQDFVRRMRPDVVHAHDYYGLMSQGLQLPRVFTIHGFIHEDTQYTGGVSARFRSWLWKYFELACWREQPHIISISPYVRERLRRIARGVIHDIENPIAMECFELPRMERTGTVLCAAAVCQRKNTLGLVKAVHRLRQRGVPVRLRWAGPVSEPAYNQRVLDYVAAHRLEDCVEFLGSLSAAQVRKELVQTSVFALISFEEGAPMGIAEAAAAGVPVVASNRCGMPYMVRDGEAGFLVNPCDAMEVADRLERLLRDEPLRRAAGEAARAFAQERFHPTLVARRTAAVYRGASATFNQPHSI